MNNKDKGNLGERLASQYLQSLGYEIIERNWRYSRYGEIDIIAVEKNTLILGKKKNCDFVYCNRAVYFILGKILLD